MTAPDPIDLAALRYDGSHVVVPAPGAGPGNWAGAPSAVHHEGAFWLAYRLRRPLDAGRGVAVALARSEDGVSFETVATLSRDRFGSASLERPALVPRPDGGWRLFVSCAAQDSKGWWIEAMDADTVAGLPDAPSRVVLPGTADLAVKDPVVLADRSGWRMWVCCHPLTDPGDEDRMATWLARSDDGLAWELDRPVLEPRPGHWDARGTRMTAVLPGPTTLALYDGRATAAENWFERTGLARADATGTFRPVNGGPLAQSPFAEHAFRYASIARTPDGLVRAYVEAARPDGAHDLRTMVLPAATDG